MSAFQIFIQALFTGFGALFVVAGIGMLFDQKSNDVPLNALGSSVIIFVGALVILAGALI
jgi:hypothetical protein